MTYLRAFAGLLFFLLVAYAVSSNRKQINWRLVGGGILLQLIIGLLIIRVPIAADAFRLLTKAFVRIISFTSAGTEFLFGEKLLEEQTSGFIFALQVLPTIIFFSALSAALYYLGVLQRIVKIFAWLMYKTMRLSGAESLSAAGNVFLGQTEAPLMVRPFIKSMTQSELMCLMTGGMATVAGSVLAGYVAFLGGESAAQQQLYATYLVTASFMNAPIAIVMAKIIIPETNYNKISRTLVVSGEKEGANFIDALTSGAIQGLKLAFNVAASLLVFVALVALLNYFLKDLIGQYTGLNAFVVESTGGQFEGFNLQYILGNVFRFFAWFMGVEWQESMAVGSLLGQKTVLNEFIAYIDLAEMKEAGILSRRSIVISTYALCGFANFSSIAIQIAGIGGMAPNRQGDVAKLGFRALIAGTLATLITGTLAGVIVP